MNFSAELLWFIPLSIGAITYFYVTSMEFEETPQLMWLPGVIVAGWSALIFTIFWVF